LFRNNTIVAIATPPGRGGIGVVRISGPDSLFCARKLLSDDDFSPAPNHVYVRDFLDPSTGQIIDHGVLTYFKSPHSFTGEDVVELSCHGSPILLSRIVSVVISLGIRSAIAGEFTMQAVANKRLDLSQAEAIRDLINAHSRVASSQALRQLNGELSSYIQPIHDALLEIIVILESSLEFVDEDLPDVFVENTKQRILAVLAKVQHLASTFKVGKFLKDGYKVALVGRPNVGKSSIFNVLLHYDRSIVTHIPGTTRDSVSEYINLNDLPILLTDTAGVRSSEDEVEKLGIERTHRVVVDADLVLIVLDGSSELTAEDQQIASLCSLKSV
jgi:tRNA modification GTPase